MSLLKSLTIFLFTFICLKISVSLLVVSNITDLPTTNTWIHSKTASASININNEISTGNYYSNVENNLNDIKTLFDTDFIEKIHVDKDTHQFVDTHNRVRFFHGTNVVLKDKPWIPDGSNENYFNETDMLHLKSLGLNVVRLGVMWPGVMPTFETFNETYLIEVKKIVDKLAKFGIYTVIDAHQDLLSQRFCGEGMPFFDEELAGSFPQPIAKKYEIDPITGFPSVEDCNKFPFFQYYATYAVEDLFELLYNNSAPYHFSDKFGQFWTKVAEKFNSTNSILGYEILNEPFGGNLLKNLSLLNPINSNRKIEKFNLYISNYIRKVDNNTIIMLEGVTINNGDDTGFRYIPGGDDYRNRTVLSYHYYNPPNIKPELNIKNADIMAKRLGIGVMLTEFWAHYITDEKIEELHKTLDVTRQYQHSWISWQYRCFNQRFPTSEECQGSNVTYKVDIGATVEIYPMAVAGKIVTYLFDRNSGRFDLIYTILNKVTKPETIIYTGSTSIYPKCKSICPLKIYEYMNLYFIIVHNKSCEEGTQIYCTI